MSKILVCKNISKIYKDVKEKVKVLDDLNFSLDSGKKVAIVGRSGSGKTTLLNLLCGIDSPTSGVISLFDKDVTNMCEGELDNLRNENIGVIFQSHHLLPEFSAEENVAIPLLIKGVSKVVALKQARDLLALVGLADRSDYMPANLSGGQRQRVAIARAFISSPKFILADEPTGNLDESTCNKVFDIMLELAKKFGLSMIIVTHDLKIADKLDATYVLENGKLTLA